MEYQNNMVGLGEPKPNACGDYVRPSDGQRSLKQESGIPGMPKVGRHVPM